jgi:DNA-directed RNA polymerase subunit RPC12/RpoP
MKNFTKLDEGFTCVNCGAIVPPLEYTSRDHCNKCLVSLHVDINPGDRANECRGMLVPIGITGKKDYVIEYECSKCGKNHRNKAATDDDFETILSVSNHTYQS